MELNDTIKLMENDDYKDRFKAEYYQLAIRYKKLKNMLEKWDNNTLSFTPTCPRRFYKMQLIAMEDYLIILKDRAELEKIELSEV